LASSLYTGGVFKPANLAAALAASPTEFNESNDGGTNALAGVGQSSFFANGTTLGTVWADFPEAPTPRNTRSSTVFHGQKAPII